MKSYKGLEIVESYDRFRREETPHIKEKTTINMENNYTLFNIKNISNNKLLGLPTYPDYPDTSLM